MLNEATKVYPLRISDFNPDKTIKFSSILELFQDVAGYHSNFLGCGMDDFFKKSIGWVLIGVRFQLLKPIKMYSTVTVKTWPIKPSFVKFQREYLIYDEEGEVLCKGSSLWTIIDLNTRKLFPAKGEVYHGIDDFLQTENFADKFTKIKPLNLPFEFCGKPIVKFSDVDINGHLNNVKYANFIVDALGYDVERFSNFQIDYHKEVMLGQTVSLYKSVTCDEIIVKGVIEGETIFIAKYSK